MTALDLSHTIIDVLTDKKGENILLLDIHEIAGFCDYFVICSANSSRTLISLADAIAEKVKKEYAISTRFEGLPTTGWLLLDYGDVIVHLFSPEQRDFYRIEQLWDRGKILIRLQ